MKHNNTIRKKNKESFVGRDLRVRRYEGFRIRPQEPLNDVYNNHDIDEVPNENDVVLLDLFPVQISFRFLIKSVRTNDNGVSYIISLNDTFQEKFSEFARLLNFNVDDVDFIIERNGSLVFSSDTPAGKQLLEGEIIRAKGKRYRMNLDASRVVFYMARMVTNPE